MDKIVLYCKSYHADVDRVVNLAQSIEKYNVDNLPFYVSVPSTDMTLFESKTPSFVRLIEDESIDSNNGGWIGQQVIKSQFWKLGLCENYLCLDSDSEFIKPFITSDFMFDDETPYTVVHEDKELMEWAMKAGFSFDIQKSFQEDRNKVMELFDRKGIYYDFGPSPVIWSTKVWKSLFDNYLTPNNLTFSQLIQHCGSEFTWYGEWLLTNKVIPLYPRQPLFKVFHYPQQYTETKNKGYSQEDLAKHYLGIILQSNWGAPLKY
jgi:hypothetical protein